MLEELKEKVFKANLDLVKTQPSCSSRRECKAGIDRGKVWLSSNHQASIMTP